MANDNDSDGEVTLAVGLKYGLGLIAAGVGIFFLLMLIEGSEKGARVHWLIALLYNIGGKWTAAGVLWLLGIVLLVLGIRTHIRNRE